MGLSRGAEKGEIASLRGWFWPLPEALFIGKPLHFQAQKKIRFLDEFCFLPFIFPADSLHRAEERPSTPKRKSQK